MQYSEYYACFLYTAVRTLLVNEDRMRPKCKLHQNDPVCKCLETGVRILMLLGLHCSLFWEKSKLFF